MIVRRLFEPGLAQTSYLVGCGATGEALVIDPTRDIERYVRAAAEERVRITHVTETHIHADFLSGSRELARRTGAALLLSDEGDADWKYGFLHEGRPLRNGDRFTVGRVIVEVVHTPGHTPEHLTFLITDGAVADAPIAAATGDFIFVGDVGRPDLLERAANFRGTMEAGARTLYRALRSFDAGRPEWLQIWPGHGAGSACGKGISAVPHSTLGYERRFNWAFRVPDEDAFVSRVLAGQPEPPKYFARMKHVNKTGPAILNGFCQPARLEAGRLSALLAEGAMVIDTRPPDAYADAHVQGAVAIAFNNSFSTWAGWFVDYDRPLYLIAETEIPGRLDEIARALALIGIDRVDGVFDAAAVRADAAIPSRPLRNVTPADVSRDLERNGLTVLDVRGQVEWDEGHIPQARHIPLGYLPDRLGELRSREPVVLHCQSGARSVIAASLLERAGFSDIRNMSGGFAAWKQQGLPIAAPAGQD